MKDLTNGNEARLIFQFAVPMLLGNVFQQLYNVVDSIIVGNYLGKEALAAVGATFPVMFSIISLVIGIAGGTTIIIAQYFGAKDYEKVRQSIDTMYIMLFFGSFIIAGVTLLFDDFILQAIDLPQTIIPKARLYLDITLAGSITMFGYNGTNAILRGLGDSKTPLYFLIVSTFLNIGFDLLFVLVFHWGIAGVAIATVLAQAIAFTLATIYLNRRHEIIQISFLKMRFHTSIFRKSLRIGLPSGIQQMAVALGMTALIKIVNQFGTNTIAAYSVAGRIDAFAVMPAMNFAMALSTFVGQNLGANKLGRIKSGLKATLLMTSGISIVFTLMVLLLGTQLMAVFTPEAIVIQKGATYLVIVGSFYISFSAMFSVNAVFRGAGDTIVPMFITLFSLWVIRVPLSWFLSQRIGEIGIWWGIPIAWLVGMGFAIAYYFTGRWKTKGVVKY